MSITILLIFRENKVSDEFLDKAIKYEVQKLSTKVYFYIYRFNMYLDE